MKNSRSIINILLSVFIVACPVANAMAQLQAFDCIPGSGLPSKESNAMLDSVQAHYAKVESMQGVFRQDSYVAALDEGEASSGEMLFAKPGRMRWSYKLPRTQEVVVRDGILWIYQPEQGQVMIDDIKSVLISALPISFLMGIGNLARDFSLVSACRSKAGVVIRLKPRSAGDKNGKEEGLEGFDLLVDEVKKVPKGAKIFSVGGNITGIVFENLIVNGNGMDLNKFVLEYPKGVDILDRRIHPGS